MSQNKIGIIGCGWLGLPLAKELISNNHKVKGSTTTKEKLKILKNEGIDAYLIDVAENSISDSFESFLYELDIQYGKTDYFGSAITTADPTYILNTNLTNTLLLSFVFA